MRSHTSSTDFSRLYISRRPSLRSLQPSCGVFRACRPSCSYSNLKLFSSSFVNCACPSRHRLTTVAAMDEDSVGVSSLDDLVGNDVNVEQIFSSSDGEDSEDEIILYPVTEADLPSNSEHVRTSDDGLTVSAHRLAMLSRTRKKIRIKYGVLNNIGLTTFLILLLFLLDWCAWKIVRLPLPPCFLLRPFLISVASVSCAGYVCIPLFRSLRICSIVETERPSRHSSKKEIPTMGGLFFVPIGVIVAEYMIGFSSLEVNGTAIATLAFAAIGLINDFCSLIKDMNCGLSLWVRILLEATIGISFSIWLHTAEISSPYSMKTVVPLPVPLGLVYLGKFYLPATMVCFVSMANGINLTDKLDGLAVGIAALAFVGMSIAVLPICSDLSIFGASMAGACIGFLFHNRFRASVLMGDAGGLALGGALAAMAACTGMFFPLLISSGIFVLEAITVIMQGSIFKTTKNMCVSRQSLLRIVPLHRHLKLLGFKEPIIVAGAYAISSVLILCAGYVALISA